MSAILIALDHASTDAGARARAFDLAAARLRSRSDGEARVGSLGVVRWAAIASDAEFSLTLERLAVADTAPFMVEGPRGGGPHGATGADGTSPTGGDFTVVSVQLATGHAILRRDRLGTKPLFYMPLDGGWVIASEAKALTPFLSAFSVNAIALSDAVNYRWVLGEDFLLDPIRQVLPGAEVHLKPGAPAQCLSPRILTFEPHPPADKPLDWYRAQVEEALRASLQHASADGGELAVLLSGGVDSSVLAALARDEGLAVRAYIVRYEGAANPEYQRARRVAGWLGIPVTEVVVPPGDAGERLPKLVWRLEQPPRHVNNLALHRLLAATRERGRMVVHGDGAETTFGLQFHHSVRRFARKRTTAARVFGRRDWRQLGRGLGWMPGNIGVRVMRLLDQSVPDFARRLDEIQYARGARALLDGLCRGHAPCPELSGLLPDDRPPTHEELQTYQAYTFLQCSLVRLDRLSSPLGLSVSLPYLSHDVLEIARHLPTQFKGRSGEGKPILRDICSRYLPAEVARWPKMGFATPDRHWVMGPASAWCSRLFDGDDGHLSRLLQGAQAGDLLGSRDHETRWLLITLELALRQLQDRQSVEPGSSEGVWSRSIGADGET